jgi:hypothetical protein
MIGTTITEAGAIFMGFAGIIAEAGRFIVAAVRFILGGFTPLGWLITAITAAWALGLGDWLAKLNVFGHSVGDWASSLADKVANSFQNMWVRTKQYFGFLSADAAAAQIEANNRANAEKQAKLGFGGAQPVSSTQPAVKTAPPRGAASGEAQSNSAQTDEQKRIAAQIAKNKAEAAGLLGGGGKKRNRFKNYDANLDDAKNDLRLEEDELSRHMAAEEELYKAGKLSIDEYYDDKLTTMRKSINAQIAELERERAAYQRQGDKAGVNRADTEIELRKRDLADNDKSVEVQREKDLNDLKEKGLQLEAQILDAEGKTRQAQLARNVERAQKEKAYFERNRDVPGAEKYVTEAQQVIDIAKLNAAWDEYGETVKKVQEDTKTKEAAVDAELKAGNLTKYEAELKVFDLRKEEARQLDELIKKERALIEASDAPQATKDRRLKPLDRDEAYANAVLSQRNPDVAHAEERLNVAVQGGFNTFFKDIISGSKSAGNAFKEFANNITDVINQLVAEQLGKQLFRSLFGEGGINLGGSGGGSMSGGGGFFGALFGGGKSATPDANADITMVNGDAGGGFWDTIVNLLPKFDVGAMNVPQDMLAHIHQGEMIVPKYDAERIRSGGFGQGHTYVTNNNFTVAGSVTRETQSQIAYQAGLGVSRASRRNG